MRNPAESIDENSPTDRVARPADRPDDRPEAETLTVDTLWAIADVSRYLRIPASSIYKMTARHAAVSIPHIRIGGKLRFRRTDIDRWLSLLTTSNIEALSKMRRITQR